MNLSKLITLIAPWVLVQRKRKRVPSCKCKKESIGLDLRLGLSWRKSLSYRNHLTDLLCKSVHWFLYDTHLSHESVQCPKFLSYRNQSIDLRCKWMTGFYMMETLAFNELNSVLWICSFTQEILKGELHFLCCVTHLCSGIM